MRRKVDTNVPRGLREADHQILGDVIRHEGKIVDEQIRTHINMNQEKLIEELNTKLFYKEAELSRNETNYRQVLQDLDVYKRKYSKLKHQKSTNVEETIKDLKLQMSRLEHENKQLGSKLKSASSQRDDQLKAQGTTLEKQLLARIDDLSHQLECSNELRRRLEKEFEHYRANSYSQKREFSDRASKLHENTEMATKEIKQALKLKMKQKMDQFEKNQTESLRTKMFEAELNMQCKHRREIDAINDKYKNYIEIREHEIIVQRELDLKHDQNLRFINELKDDHEANLSLLHEDFNSEQEKLRQIVLNLENRLEQMSSDFARALQEKERVVRELTQQHNLHQDEETRILIQKEASLRGQLNQREQEVSEMEFKLEEAQIREQSMSEELQQIRQNVYDLEQRQVEMEEITNALDLKSRLAISLEQQVEELSDQVAQYKQKYYNFGWTLRNKYEEVKRVKNEIELAKRLLQGELSIFKHELEQRCKFILEFAKRNEKSNVKYFAEKDGQSAKMQQLLFQVDQTGLQNGKLLAEISEKNRVIEGLNRQYQEMTAEFESLQQRVKQSDQVRQACQRLETENGQLRFEVSQLQQARFDLQAKQNEDLQKKEQELKTQFDQKLKKKIAKEQILFEDQLKFTNQQLKELAMECEEYRNRAYTFQNVILKLKEQRDLKKLRAKEQLAKKGQQSLKIEKIVTKSIAKAQNRSPSLEDKSSQGRQSIRGTFMPSQSQHYSPSYTKTYKVFDQRQSCYSQNQMVASGSNWKYQTEQMKPYQNHRKSSKGNRLPSSDSVSGAYYKNQKHQADTNAYKASREQLQTDSKNGTARFHKPLTQMDSEIPRVEHSPQRNVPIKSSRGFDVDLMQSRGSNQALNDEFMRSDNHEPNVFSQSQLEPLKQIQYVNMGGQRPRSPILTYQPQMIKSQTSQSYANTSNSLLSKDAIIIPSIRSDKENPQKSNSFERRLQQNERRHASQSPNVIKQNNSVGNIQVGAGTIRQARDDESL